MKYLLAICGISLVFSLGAVGQAPATKVAAPPQSATQFEGGMLGFSAPSSEGGQMITLVDTNQRTMSVYHVDSSTGQITLRSVRRLTSDFAIEAFNARPPLPAEIEQIRQKSPPP